MHLKIIIALFIFISFSIYGYANDEEEFKNTCLVIADVFNKLTSFKNAADMPDGFNKRAEKIFAIQSQYLKRFVQLNPDSIWVDDAQYIFANLKGRYPEQAAEELEYLLEKYPNINIEDWTKSTLPSLISIDPDFDTRLQLLAYYQLSGEKAKLKALCDESIKKFPEKAQFFKKIKTSNK